MNLALAGYLARLFVHDEFVNEVPCTCNNYSLAPGNSHYAAGIREYSHVADSKDCPASYHAAVIGEILYSTGAAWLPKAPPKAEPKIVSIWSKA